MSESQLQQLFQRWSGASPERFFALLSPANVRQRLLRDRPALHVSPDWMERITAASPAERRPGGLVIHWGIADSPYGRVGIGRAARGLCWLEFLERSQTPASVALGLARTWPNARLEHHPAAAAAQCAHVFAGERPPLLLGGTPFQRQVWRLLVRIPPGTVTTYGALAAALECPGAGRAVGAAVGRNSIGYLIPCHRVIRSDGGLAGFRWGIVRKKALLGHEAVQRAVPSST